VTLAGYGLADAEHRVEKEVRAIWPECAVQVLDVARPPGSDRIVEEFAVRYRLRGTVEVEAETPAAARAAALRLLRERFAGTRYARVAWDQSLDLSS
jgi:hypothetical protein